MIKAPVTYTIYDPNRFKFAVYKDANGVLSPEQIADALNATAREARLVEALERLRDFRFVAKSWNYEREINQIARVALAEARRIMEGK